MWSTSSYHHVPVRFPAFPPVLVFGCERKQGTIYLIGLNALALAIHGQRNISIARVSKNSRIRETDIGRLFGPLSVATHPKSNGQRERRRDTSDPS
jgi:hypothetical protein